MTKLHEIKNDTSALVWCGPAAVCTVTGWPMSAVRKIITERRRGRSGRKPAPVMGMTTHELHEAFVATGWAMEQSQANAVSGNRGERPTLAAWLRGRGDRSECNLVLVTGHFVVVCANRFVDSRTGGPVSIGKAPGRRARVSAVYRLTPKAPLPVPAAKPAPRKRAKRPAPAAPYRVGFVQDGAFVPVADWVDKSAVETHVALANTMAAVAGVDGPSYEGEGQAPVVVQRKKDGAYIRAFAFYDFVDGFVPVSGLTWYDTPLMAAMNECR